MPALYAGGQSQEEVLVVICPEHVAHLKEAGWSSQQVREYLYEATKLPLSALPAERSARDDASAKAVKGTGALASPDAVVPIVAGGDGGGWSMVIPMWSFGSKTRSVTKRIEA